MRKFQTIAVTALSTLALSGAGFTAYQMSQPTHYEGATFTNEKNSTTHSNSNNMASSNTNISKSYANITDSSSDTTVPTQSSSVTEQEPTTEQNTNENPKFYAYLYVPNGTAGVESSNNYYEFRAVYTVTGEEVSCGQDSKDAELFCKWMESIAYGKDHLDNSLQSNYNYWKENVKGQQ